MVLWFYQLRSYLFYNQSGFFLLCHGHKPLSRILFCSALPGPGENLATAGYSVWTRRVSTALFNDKMNLNERIKHLQGLNYISAGFIRCLDRKLMLFPAEQSFLLLFNLLFAVFIKSSITMARMEVTSLQNYSCLITAVKQVLFSLNLLACAALFQRNGTSSQSRTTLISVLSPLWITFLSSIWVLSKLSSSVTKRFTVSFIKLSLIIW